MARRPWLPLGRVDLSLPRRTGEVIYEGDQGGNPRAAGRLGLPRTSPTITALTSYTTSWDLTSRWLGFPFASACRTRSPRCRQSTNGEKRALAAGRAPRPGLVFAPVPGSWLNRRRE